MSCKPFTIHVPAEELDDLQRRLASTRFPEKETVDDWSQGTPLAFLEDLLNYWLSEYDWRSREAALNRFKQFRMDIEGLGIHFIHMPSPHPGALPLIMTHGWPGSIVEFHKVIEQLVNGDSGKDAFHVVCPSLPGYGFSDKPSQSGCGVPRIAKLWNQLMVQLGYERYVAQGGDWGSMVTGHIGMQNLGNCAGIHMNMLIVPPDPESLAELTDSEKAALRSMKDYEKQDSGYSKQQSTRPQSVGYGLVDSPAALAGWIVEKFHRWSDCKGDPWTVFSRDEILDNLMLYWVNRAGASSARLYWESFGDVMLGPFGVPYAASVFPKEIFRPSKRWAQALLGEPMYWGEPKKGGHFAAFEQPELFVQELRAAFRPLR